MPRPRKVTLRESELATPEEAHARLALKLDFPDYYGANLDALEDCLGDIDEPTRIVLVRAEEETAWFDDFVEVICESAQRSCYLGCTIRP
ncbi:MAG: barstar family protein [Atopobiaceae bacterium]|nr:barstar family protein [Atopobiaceae bacterium]MBR3314161.1 barstar family protein [Atopobiaceae bacterium]